MNNVHKVLSVQHWTGAYFLLKLNVLKILNSNQVICHDRSPEWKKTFRAYSICSPNWSDELEFYSIIVKNGPLTSKLKNIKVNDEIILMPKSTGTLILDALLPGKRLFLFSTGTGFAPFASIIRDPETYDKYQKIIVTHTCRNTKEVEYSNNIVNECNRNEILQEFTKNKLVFYQTTTREKSSFFGRITEKILDKSIYRFKYNNLNNQNDRVMICGSIEFNNDLKNILLDHKFNGATNKQELCCRKSICGIKNLIIINL